MKSTRDLLITSLKHWCDFVWEYNGLTDQLFVHFDRLASQMENKWYAPQALIDTFTNELSFKVSKSEKECHFNQYFLKNIYETGIEREDFQLWFYLNIPELKWYNIRLERIDCDSMLITGKNMYDEINKRSMHKSLKKSFDYILCLDTKTENYIVSYDQNHSRMPIEEYNYPERIVRFVEKYVIDMDKEQLLQSLRLEHVKKMLEKDEDYAVYMTVCDADNILSYKRLLFSYFDETKQRILISRIDISNIVQRYEKQILKIKKENFIDILTGVHNRNYYETNIKNAVISGGIAMIDLDDFKLCNDTYGHKIGDIALVHLANIIKQHIGSSGELIRYGGDEFLLIVRQTSEEAFESMLKKIQKQVYNEQIPGFESLKLSVSIGGVMAANSSVEEAVIKADKMMYIAKNQKSLVVTEKIILQQDHNALETLDKNDIKQQVLIVDDSEMNRMILSEMLKSEFRILEASNGTECLSMIKQYGTGISLILLDIVMPEMNGFEVLQEMERQNTLKDIPVIMISSSDSDENIRRAYELGVSDYINRPFNTNIVYRRVRNTIILSAKQRRLVSIITQQSRERAKSQNLMIDVLSHVIGYRSGESHTHLQHIKKITAMLLEALANHDSQYALSQKDRENIATAATLHDIGKIGIDEKILYKAGKLTPQECEIINTHTTIGEMLIKNFDMYKTEPLLQIAAQICRWHHERFDGNGYPDGLRGDEIPISTQVVSLADAYDALISERVYKKAYSNEKAIEMIQNGECGAFNPLLIECLLQIKDKLAAELFPKN